MSERYKQPESEAEYVAALRDAWVDGRRTAARDRCFFDKSEHCSLCEEEARRRYPLTRSVPRAVGDEFDVEWKFEDGGFWRRDEGRETWLTGDGSSVTPNRVRLWADLLANPIREVTE